MAGATKKREARKSLHQPGWITLEGGFAARPCVVQGNRMFDSVSSCQIKGSGF